MLVMMPGNQVSGYLDFRIQPDTGLIDAQAGQTQFGRRRDDWGNWFGCNNSNPMWHFVLGDHYLRRNPHLAAPGSRINVSVTPGGSGGGAGAAVSAGLTALDVSGDMGGSTRVPASHCGVFGLKPTYGRVSRHGVVPLAWTLDHCGPLTWDVEDAALMLQAVAGHDPRDPTTSSTAVASAEFITASVCYPSPEGFRRRPGCRYAQLAS